MLICVPLFVGQDGGLAESISQISFLTLDTAKGDNFTIFRTEESFTMKSITFLFLLCSTALYGQYLGGKKWVWPEVHYAGLYDVCEQPDGAFLIPGWDTYNFFDRSRMVLIKTDAQLNVLWAKEIREESDTFFNRIIPTMDGNYLVGGTDFGFDTIPSGPSLYKMDGDGNMLWNKVYGFYNDNLGLTGSDGTDGLFEWSDGSITLIDQTHLASNFPRIYHLNSDGAFLTMNRLIVENEGIQFNSGVCHGENDQLYLLGYHANYLNEHNIIFIVALNSSGINWVKNYEFEGGAIPLGITYTPDGHLLVGGKLDTDTAVTDFIHPFLFKTDMEGNVIWAHQYNSIDTSSNSYIHLLRSLNNSHCIAFGGRHTDQGNVTQLMEINTVGEIVWTTTLSQPAPNSPHVMLPLSDGRIFTHPNIAVDTSLVMILNAQGQNACTTGLHNMTSQDLEVIISTPEWQYPAETSVVREPAYQIFTLDIGTEEICATPNGLTDPDQLSAIQVFPNPSTGLVNIRFDQTPAKVSLRVFDTQGKLVKELNRITPHTRLDLSDQPAGLYLLRILTEKGVISKRVVIR